MQSGNWDMAAQAQNLQNAFNEWQMKNQLGFADNQAQNDWNFVQQQQQQNFMNQLLGGILGGML